MRMNSFGGSRMPPRMAPGVTMGPRPMPAAIAPVGPSMQRPTPSILPQRPGAPSPMPGQVAPAVGGAIGAAAPTPPPLTMSRPLPTPMPQQIDALPETPGPRRIIDDGPIMGGGTAGGGTAGGGTAGGGDGQYYMKRGGQVKVCRGNGCATKGLTKGKFR